MTNAQRQLAERLIAAALEREAIRKAKYLEISRFEEVESCACCEKLDLPAAAHRRTFDFISKKSRMDSSLGLPRLDAPANAPRKPDLHAANLSFAARVIIYVRDRFKNDAPSVYKAAYLSRKTYSAIISDENRTVSKRTAIQLAFALHLSRGEAGRLLHAAGFHLSRSVVEDMIFDACLEAKIYTLEDINTLLEKHECRIFIPQS